MKESKASSDDVTRYVALGNKMTTSDRVNLRRASIAYIEGLLEVNRDWAVSVLKLAGTYDFRSATPSEYASRCEVAHKELIAEAIEYAQALNLSESTKPAHESIVYREVITQSYVMETYDLCAEDAERVINGLNKAADASGGYAADNISWFIEEYDIVPISEQGADIDELQAQCAGAVEALGGDNPLEGNLDWDSR